MQRDGLGPLARACLPVRKPRGITGASPRRRSSFPSASRIRFEFDLPTGGTLTTLWHDGEFCNEVPRPAALEEGRELGNRIPLRRGYSLGV